MNEFWEKLKAWVTAHKWACIFGAAGIVYVLLWFEIGFWRTILLTIAAGICIFIGTLIDNKKKNGDEE